MNLTLAEKERLAFISGDSVLHSEIVDNFDIQSERESIHDMVNLIDAAITAYYDKKSTPRHAFKVIRDAILMHCPEDMMP